MQVNMPMLTTFSILLSEEYSNPLKIGKKLVLKAKEKIILGTVEMALFQSLGNSYKVLKPSILVTLIV